METPKLHAALIMDGNGRWAASRGLPRVAGHRAGAEAVRRVIEAAPALGVGTPKVVVAGRTATVRFSPTAATERTEVRLQRRRAGAYRTVATARTAKGTVRFRTLAPGRYRARLRALAGSRASAARSVAFRVPR